MRKLLSANLNRLLMNKGFWLTVIFMICTEILFFMLLLNQGSISMDFMMYITLPGIGVLTSVFLSVFFGTEYSDGTIRNKVVVGHQRHRIYLASLLTGVVGISIIYFAGVLIGSIFGMLAFAPPSYSTGQIAIAGIIGWLSCISYVSIFNLVGMLSSSKAKTSIICILTAFILAFIGLLCYSIGRPGILSGSAQAVFQFMLEFNPFGQTIQAMSVEIAAPWRLAAYSLFLSVVLTGFGICMFHKKDLK